MRNTLWLFLTLSLFGNSPVFGKMPSNPSFAVPINVPREKETQENSSKKNKVPKKETSNCRKDLPDFAVPINPDRKREAKTTNSLQQKLEKAFFKKEGLEQRLSSAENWLDLQEKKKFLANPNLGCVSVEILGWKSKVHQDRFGLIAPPASTLSNGLTVPGLGGKYARLHSSWKAGVRLGIGQKITSTWQSSLFWTFYRGYASRQIAAPRLVVPFFFGSVADGARSQWRLTYQTIDWELASALYLMKRMTLKPFLGLRGLFLHQRFQSIYNWRTLLAQGALASVWVFGTPLQLFKEKYWGLGPRGGIFVTYECGNTGLHLYGNFSASIVTGRVHIDEKEELFIPASGTLMGLPIRISNFYRSGFGSTLAGVQGILGAEYRYAFEKRKMAFCARFGWEANYWWHIENYPPPQENDDLSLYGITAGVGFEY
jgi:hypothetical protein